MTYLPVTACPQGQVEYGARFAPKLLNVTLQENNKNIQWGKKKNTFEAEKTVT